MDLERIPGYMADYLSANGVAAEPAWSGRERTALAGPKAVVSVRKCQMGPAGFQDYLGERFDKDSGQWRELYGRSWSGRCSDWPGLWCGADRRTWE